MADEAKTPTMTSVPRAVHELRTGPKPEQTVAPGTLITEEVGKQHKIDGKTIEALTASGAIELVEVLKG